MPIRFLILLACLGSWANADLTARFTTTRGVIDVVLDYTNAPQAVASFIKLAEGTQSRVDPNNGQVTYDPLYIGETFFRTANSSFTKFAQTGSGSGDNVGNAGWAFKDEFTQTQRHTGYTLSLANSGPNTNAGQIFLTGNVTIPSYDDVHTIAGRITASSSQAVVDSVIAAGNNATTITDVQILRTSPEAIAFDEDAQNLPTVSPVAGSLSVNRGSSVDFIPQTALQSEQMIRAYRSEDLSNWNVLTTSGKFVGIDDSPRTTLRLDSGFAAKAFYQPSLIHHPEAYGPSSLANRSVIVDFSDQTHTYTFDATGIAGNLLVVLDAGGSVNGNFTLTSLRFAPHSTTFEADTGIYLTYDGFRYDYDSEVNCGWDTADANTVMGHHRSTRINLSPPFYPEALGDCSVSR